MWLQIYVYFRLLFHSSDIQLISVSVYVLTTVKMRLDANMLKKLQPTMSNPSISWQQKRII